jgi:hypothetical protein
MSQHNLTEEQAIEAFCHHLGIFLRRISQEESPQKQRLPDGLPRPIPEQNTFSKRENRKEIYV